jgi:O-antigen/teichoic acid export membrane protein
MISFKDFISKITKSQLIAGSVILFAGTMVANFGNYLYHLLMGRMLGPKDYGVLESVISVGYLLFIIINSLTLATARFVANLRGKKDLGGITWLFHYLNRQVFWLGNLVCLLIFILSPLIASFLHLESNASVVLIGILFLVSSLSAVSRSTLQGLLRFKEMVISHISETTLKMVAAVVLVLMGFRVNGAIFSLVVGAVAGFFLAKFFLNFLREYKPQKPDITRRRFLKFALPVLFFNLSFTCLYTNDIILVKHLFSSYEAGLYAAVALFGKIVFFATSAIPMAMFPMVAANHAQGKESRHLFLSSLGIVSVVLLGAILIYSLFPNVMIIILFGKEYLVASPLLVWMAIFISFYSLAYLLVNFFLSVDKVKSVFFPVLAAILQIILILLFHQTLQQVIQVSIGVSGLLLLVLMIYYFYGQKKNSFSYCSRL